MRFEEERDQKQTKEDAVLGQKRKRHDSDKLVSDLSAGKSKSTLTSDRQVSKHHWYFCEC